MKTRNYLTIDLGAESGRTIVGALADNQLTLTETHPLPDGLHWDVLSLWFNIQIGRSSINIDQKLESIGLDSWAVDFALLDQNESLLSNPFHYCDARTDGLLDEAFRRIPRAEIFANTGIQFMQIT
jgi:rhamnulokinase